MEESKQPACDNTDEIDVPQAVLKDKRYIKIKQKEMSRKTSVTAKN